MHFEKLGDVRTGSFPLKPRRSPRNDKAIHKDKVINGTNSMGPICLLNLLNLHPNFQVNDTFKSYFQEKCVSVWRIKNNQHTLSDLKT